MKKNASPTILICAATAGELAACPATFLPAAERFVSGVGIPATFVSFWHYLDGRSVHDRLDGILNLGIAGAYPDTGINIGDIVLGDSDVYGDVGVELPGAEGFLPMSEMTYGKAFYGSPLMSDVPDWLADTIGPCDGFRIHRGRGSTVNTCTGSDTVGRQRARQTGAVFETMEGAAVLQIGQMAGIPVCQIRAISNIASTRDMRPENIRLALEHLTHFLGNLSSPFPMEKRSRS